MANLWGFYWVVYTIKVFGGFSYGLSTLIFLLFIAVEALQIALFSLVMCLFGMGPLYLFPALFWVAIEFWFPHLFPWYLANSQARFLTFIQSADLVGPYGTSFLLVWFNATLYSAIFSRGEHGRIFLREGAILGALLVGTLLYGHLRLSTVSAKMGEAPSLSLAAIQGNIDIERKWNLDQLKANLKSYQDLTRKAQGASLVIWPETAVELWLPENSRQLGPEILPSLNADSAFFIFGVRSFRGDPNAPNFKAFNSAFITDARGRVLGHYHKQILLAFGEYIPFASLLSKLPGVPPISNGFTPGEGPRTLDLSGGIKVAALICYEDLMPRLARKFVAEKEANLLVNLTNDAWYGHTVAPWQHARLAQWRAIETRRYLVRVTNTGVTTVIDPRGEMLQSLPTFSSGVLTTNVGIIEGETLYVRFGDWFAWIITLLSLGIAVWIEARKTTARSPSV
jgi:apolipoprotein N-acyltransferase